METLLIYKDEVSNKFWKINVTGKAFTITYGKVGSIGSVKTKEFDSEELCQKEAHSVQAEKRLCRSSYFCTSDQRKHND